MTDAYRGSFVWRCPLCRAVRPSPARLYVGPTCNCTDTGHGIPMEPVDSDCLVPLTRTRTASSVLDMGIEKDLTNRFTDLGMDEDRADALAWSIADVADRIDLHKKQMEEAQMERDNLICEAATNGMPYREIAGIVKVSHQRVAQVVRGEA